MDGFKEWNKESSFLNRFLFPAPKPSYSWKNFHGEIIAINDGNSTGKEASFPCLLMPGVRPKADGKEGEEESASTVFIYCHANGEDMGLCYEAGHWMSENLGVHVVVPEYPSYGSAPGQANEISVYNNVKAAYDMVVNGIGFCPRRVVMFGRSIGTGPAVRLASELDVGGLVLVSPFTSIRDIVNDHIGFLASILADGFTDIFPSKEAIRLAECPTLIVHGSLDRVIPISQSTSLHKESGAICKKLVILEGIGHHGIDLHIAVVNEAPRMFSLGGDPKDLNIDRNLSDPAQTNGRILSPVPAWDCVTRRWSKASLPSGTTPKVMRDWKHAWSVGEDLRKAPGSLGGGSPLPDSPAHRGGASEGPSVGGMMDGLFSARKYEAEADEREREQFRSARDQHQNEQKQHGGESKLLQVPYTPREIGGPAGGRDTRSAGEAATGVPGGPGYQDFILGPNLGDDGNPLFLY